MQILTESNTSINSFLACSLMPAILITAFAKLLVVGIVACGGGVCDGDPVCCCGTFGLKLK